jgi:predicted metal-dependent enzyme (double-stranded beta helix superfamily)
MQNTSPTRQKAIHQWGMEIGVNTIQTYNKKAKTKTTACITNVRK